MKIIELRHVYKKYQKNIVLNDINFVFLEGLCYLLVGENGSGKTTLIKSILGLIKIKGEVIVNCTKIGYIPDSLVFPEKISVYEFLYNIGLIKKIKKGKLKILIDKYLNSWDLINQKHKKISELSKGMRQKVLIIQAFISSPDIYIFDEALNGLDFNMQNKLFEEINILKNDNKTIIITSHYENIYKKKLFDEVIYFKEGKINVRAN